jgi:fucose 4-O-acetylase-like acetyltransferase
MLVAVFLTNLPISMIFFSRILRYKINRPLNIGVGIFTIIYVWGGMSLYPHYIAMAIIETILALSIIWIAWTWKNNEE